MCRWDRHLELLLEDKWSCHLPQAAATEWNLFATDFASYVFAPPRQRRRPRSEATSFLRFSEVPDAEEHRLAEGGNGRLAGLGKCTCAEELLRVPALPVSFPGGVVAQCQPVRAMGTNALRVPAPGSWPSPFRDPEARPPWVRPRELWRGVPRDARRPTIGASPRGQTLEQCGLTHAS